MARPTPTTPFQEDLYASLAPIADQDEELGYPLLNYVGALASMFDQIETYARDDLTDLAHPKPGWSIVLDADRVPSEALPWLAQFVGVDVDLSLSLTDQRAQVKSTGGFKRGTIGSIIGAAQKTLTGTKTVMYKERDSAVSSIAGGAYGLTILTLTSETADSAKTLAAINSQKPAGIILNYQTVTGATYLALRTNYATYSAVKAAYLTYSGVRNGVPGT